MAFDRSPAVWNASLAWSKCNDCVTRGFTSIRPLAHQLHGEGEFGIEAERPAQFDFLGDERVDRQRHVAAKTELDDDAARAERVERAGQSGLMTAGFEQDMDRSFVGRVVFQAIGFGRDIDRRGTRQCSWPA